jgi:hypothetical protein
VLHAPEAASCYSGGLRACGHVHGGGGGGAHAEWSDEAGEKGHREVGESDEEKDWEELQVGWLFVSLREKTWSGGFMDFCDLSFAVRDVSDAIILGKFVD